VSLPGDGNNDICPVLRQRACDFACARKGFAMEKHLLRNRSKLKLRAQLLIWKSGFDLMDQMLALPQLKTPQVQGDGDQPDQDADTDGKVPEVARRASAVAGPTKSPN